jgi:hypothetical protein
MVRGVACHYEPVRTTAKGRSDGGIDGGRIVIDLLGQPGLGERCGHGGASEGVRAVSKNAANCDGSHAEGLSLGRLDICYGVLVVGGELLSFHS